MISFFVGVMVGGIVGVFFMALVNASHITDFSTEDWESAQMTSWKTQALSS